MLVDIACPGPPATGADLALRAGDPIHIQFTSGCRGLPRGVTLKTYAVRRSRSPSRLAEMARSWAR